MTDYPAGNGASRDWGAARIVLLYAVVGALWMAFVDQPAGLASDQADHTLLVTLKGWAFVGLTAALLFWLVRRHTTALQRAHRASEARYKKLNRGYAVLSDINQAIVRIRDPQALIQRACEIAVQQGGFQLAWIALLDDEAQQLRAVAHAGRGERYLDAQGRALIDALPAGCPIEAALRDERHVICNAIEDQADRTPCRQLMLELGGRASAAFPLIVSGAVRGTFNLYASEPGFFDESEIRLLDELAQDLSFALEAVEKEAERARADAALRQSEAFIKTVLDNLPIGIAVNSVDPTVTFTYMNDNFARFYRTTRDKLADADTFWDAVYEDPVFREQIKQRVLADVASGDPDRMRWVDVPITRQGEETTYITARNIPIADQQPMVISTVWDVTERKQAEQAIESLARFPGENPNPVMRIDGEGRLLYANEASRQLLPDWQLEVGQSAPTILRDAALKTLRENADQIIETALGGRVFSFFVVPIAAGYANLYGRDVTERAQAEEALRQLNVELEQRVRERTAELSDLYNNAPCGYHSLDGDGVFVRINDTELKWLGYSREEIIGRVKFPDLLTAASRETFYANFPRFKERGWVSDLEFELVRKDGAVLPVLLNATAIKDENGRYLMSRSTIIDHTERQRAERALQASQARLEAANRELEAFAYSVSHDLRAPLRAIDGFSRILQEEYADRLDAEGRRLLDIVRSNAQRMDRLIADLLALSRVARTELLTTRLDMAALAQAVYDEIAPPDVQAKFTFTVAPLPVADGDATLLRQVWSNLLSNAIKYTLPKAVRRIEVGGYRQGDEHVYFVKDTGVGFNPAYTHKLFGVFQRLHRAEDFEGTGVGLAIVQRIIARHHGRVWAEGRVDEGAIFYFALPQREVDYEPSI